MEYKLNKIDTELRQRVQDITKPGKIHGKADIEIRDNNKGRDGNHQQQESLKNKTHETVNKKLIVDATLNEDFQVEAFIQKEKSRNIPKGSFLDMKK